VENEDGSDERPVGTQVNDDYAEENCEDGSVDLMSPPKYLRNCWTETVGSIPRLDLRDLVIHA
jgi:hypothetical protein